MPNNLETLNKYEQAILAGTITLILETWADIMPQDTASRLLAIMMRIEGTDLTAQTLAEYILKKYGS